MKSERATAKRINRRLNKSGAALRKCRTSSRWYHDLGDYYIIDLATNSLVGKHVDIEALNDEFKGDDARR